MSVKVMSMVWESGLPKNQKMTLLAYADHANDDGTSVYPGEAWMAEKTSDSPGNVRRVTKQLVDDGVLARTQRAHRGRRAEFRINLTVLAAHIARHSEALEAARQDADSRASKSERRAPTSKKARAQATPNTSDPSGEPSVTLAATPRERDYLWDSFVAVHGQPTEGTERAKFNKARKLLKDAGVTPDEYPMLVAAYSMKNPGASEPAPMTVATRIGEMRHFLKRGPITVPDRETLERQRRVAAAQEEYDNDQREAIG